MIGDLATFLRKPERHLHQLKCYHDTLATERLVMGGQVEHSIPLSKNHEERSLARLSLTGYAGILSQVILVTTVLECLDERPPNAEGSNIMCDDVISLAKKCHVFRPLGTFWMPELLKLVWASVRDCYRHREIEDLIAEYEKDTDEPDFIGEARDIQARFDRLRRRRRTPEVNLLEEGVDDAPACIIL